MYDSYLEFELHKIPDDSLLEAGEHQPGVPFKGPSGRWFVINKSGRTVPAKNPDAKQDAPKGPASKPTAPKATSKPTQPTQPKHEDDDPDDVRTPKEREEESTGDVKVPKGKPGFVRSISRFIGRHISKGAGKAYATGGIVAFGTYELLKIKARAARGAYRASLKLVRHLSTAENTVPAKMLDKLGSIVHKVAEKTGTNWGGWSDPLPKAGSDVLHKLGISMVDYMQSWTNGSAPSKIAMEQIAAGSTYVLPYVITYTLKMLNSLPGFEFKPVDPDNPGNLSYKDDRRNREERKKKLDDLTPKERAGRRGTSINDDEKDLFAMDAASMTPFQTKKRDELAKSKRIEDRERTKLRRSQRSDKRRAAKADDEAAKFLLGEAREDENMLPLIADLLSEVYAQGGMKVPRETIEKLLKELR